MMKAINRAGYTQMAHRIIVSIIAAVFVAGCASTPATPVSTEQMAVSRAALDSAISAGGNTFAPSQTTSAIEKMADAERAVEKKNYALAQQLAEQAEVDARLAEAMARAAKAQKAAAELRESDRVLRREIDRNRD